MKRLSVAALCLLYLPFALPLPAFAEDNVSKVIALRGKAEIERGPARLAARVNEGIQIIDKVSTFEASRTKMLFLDDTILTLGENSRVVIVEYLRSKDDRGKSIFNLLEGKMKAVVGKTQFEVHTPTAVAAARGTVILVETGLDNNGKPYTIVNSLEGLVDVSGKTPGSTGTTTLTPGTTVTVVEGTPVPPAAPAPVAQVASLQASTNITMHEIPPPEPAKLTVAGAPVAGGAAASSGGTGGARTPDSVADVVATASSIVSPPPVAQQPLAATGKTPVNVNVTFR